MKTWLVGTRYLVTAAALAVPACSLTLDYDSLSNQECGAGEKFCENAPDYRCVAKSDPEYGCARAGCQTCFASHVAQSNCNFREECAVRQCDTGWFDCNGVYSDGCEVDITSDTANCGECGKECGSQAVHAEMKCVNRSCQIASCEDGYDNCDFTPSNGCETNITASATNCGGCRQACAGSCVDGQCQ